VPSPVTEPLAVLLLPSRLEDFELEAQARDLLQIPRVIAIEPSPHRTPKFLRESAPLRQARRLRFPGEPRVIVLYHPGQYPLARALCARHEHAELWYLRGDPTGLAASLGYSREELLELDELACARAGMSPIETGGAVTADINPDVVNESLRARLRELEVISARPFVPGARINTR
jgi:hypothetical protein